MRGCECGAASNCVNGDDTDCRPGHWLPPNIGTPAPGDPRLKGEEVKLGEHLKKEDILTTSSPLSIFITGKLVDEERRKGKGRCDERNGAKLGDEFHCMASLSPRTATHPTSSATASCLDLTQLSLSSVAPASSLVPAPPRPLLAPVAARVAGPPRVELPLTAAPEVLRLLTT
mmetsp:Transcript_100346/g.146515  ORF Transcript_100346/g.146515 Transcript_100346/m.146515 type:complete len:173 (+) Transcript_100346:530-1048(+)|eukprot:CAMPEP_0173128734 /NCGR_PEP_ID=MMETSP1102-20130122/58728_1 /TAXON_ID=49646 /ORGANISM="Geminigera sp., Strain Caron Lab Isolate" /LENGTH=172 /DNA_ID=CAMNT_0014038929 /DNA_START=530 /DNA_END=1048 /DNA_ORIENTATION=-